VAVLGMGVFVPAAILFPLMPSAAGSLALLVPYVVGSAASSSAAAAAILDLTPAAMRGQGSSLYLLATSTFGFILGPATTGYLSQRFGTTGGLGEALVVVACVYGIPAPIVLGWNALREGRSSAGAGGVIPG
jgi:MFS family permease